MEHYRAKLIEEVKAHSKKVTDEFNQRISEALREQITKRIADELEARVRRGDPSIKDGESFLSLAE